MFLCGELFSIFTPIKINTATLLVWFFAADSGDSMSRSLFKTIALSLILILFAVCSGTLHAQTSFGQIAGTVTDNAGAVVPGANITVTNLDTKAVRTAKSDDSGYYILTNLPIGNYTVELAMPGFRGEKRSGIVITADAHLSADFSLQIGAATESVTVSAVVGETLNTTSGEVARVIDSKQVENLALNV